MLKLIAKTSLSTQHQNDIIVYLIQSSHEIKIIDKSNIWQLLGINSPKAPECPTSFKKVLTENPKLSNCGPLKKKN